MAAMTEITCKCGCGVKKMVRTADVRRGWGQFATKSCKARKQTRDQFRKGGSRIDPRVVAHYGNEYGGQPQFASNGDYLGFAGQFVEGE